MRKPARSRKTKRLLISSLSAIEGLEPRTHFAVHNDSFDVTGLTNLRSDPNFSAITGSGVTIAVLDTGVDAANSELTSKVLAYYNAVENSVPSTIGSNSVANAKDNDGHGTHVSGIAASSNPDIGVAYGANLVDVKVIADSGESQLSGDPLLRGLDFVAAFANQFNIKVVNMSLGEATSSGGVNLNTVPAADDISREIQVLEAMGITVVAASGNSYANDPVPGEGYPAVVSTISVANTWSDNGPGYNFGTYSYGSQYDSWAAVETAANADQFSATSQRSTLTNQVVAPGMNIYSDWNGTSTDNSGSDLLHNTISGTSMASPFVAGLVALIQNAAHVYGGQYISDPNEILEIIKNTSDTITDNTVVGDGRVPITNGQLDSTTVSALPGTGDSYDRVDVLKAIQEVKALFTGAASTADINNLTTNATSAPDLNGTESDTKSGVIGTDGLNQVGANDVDLYKITLDETGTLTAALSESAGGTAFIATVRLFDSSGTQIGTVSGTNSAGYPTLTSTGSPLAAGVYYIGISSAGNNSYSIIDGSAIAGGSTTGDYSLTVSLTNPDPNGVPAGAVAVDLTNPNIRFTNTNIVANEFVGTLGSDPVPGSTTDRITVANGDVDMFKIVAPDTGVLSANVNATTYGIFGGADSFVEVFDSNLNVIASNGQLSNFASNSQVQFSVTLGQTYYVAITVDSNAAFNPTDPFGRVTNSTANSPMYTLDLIFNNGNTDGTAWLARQGTVGQSVSGSISSSVSGMGANGGFKYVDWYTYTVSAAGLLDLTATATTDGFSPNVQIWTLASDSQSITEVGSVTGSESPLIDQLTAGQTVYVSVTGRGNSSFNWFSLASGSGGETGAYTLASQLLPLSQLKSLNDGSINNGTPQTISAGQSIAGNLGQYNGLLVGDPAVDLYKFVPTTSGLFDLRTDTSQEGSADTVLRLFDSGGNQISMNDNGSDSSTASFIRASLTAGQTYYIGVSGSGNSTYSPVDGSGTTDGKVGTYVVSVAAATMPAVSIASPAPVEEPNGPSATADISFVVSLDSAAASVVTISYATVDSTALAGTNYTATSGTLTFQPGVTSQTVTVPVLFDSAATGTSTFFLNLTSVSSNAVVAGGEATGTITALPVTTLTLSAQHPVTYTNAAGHKIALHLSGPGSGQVAIVGDNAASVSVTVNGSTAASRLTISTNGDVITVLSDLQINGSLAALIAPHVDLEGDLTVTGTIKTLVLAKVGGGHTLAIDGAGAAASILLKDVSDLTVSTTEPITTLSAAGFSNAGGTDSITAPFIKTLITKGDFTSSLTLSGNGVTLGSARIGGAISGGTWTIAGSIGAITANSVASASLTAQSINTLKVKQDMNGNITLTGTGTVPSLRNLTVGGALTGSNIRTAGNINAIKVGALVNSNVFASVSSSVTAMPTAASEFISSADILSFVVLGIPQATFAVTNSNVAAAELGNVVVRKVQTANNAVPFGFAATTIKSFQDIESTAPAFKWTPKKPTSSLTFAGDFKVSVL